MLLSQCVQDGSQAGSNLWMGGRTPTAKSFAKLEGQVTVCGNHRCAVNSGAATSQENALRRVDDVAMEEEAVSRLRLDGHQGAELLHVLQPRWVHGRLVPEPLVVDAPNPVRPGQDLKKGTRFDSFCKLLRDSCWLEVISSTSLHKC